MKSETDQITELLIRLHKLEDLCILAADALEEEFGSLADPAYGVKGPIHELIAELRKAAQ